MMVTNSILSVLSTAWLSELTGVDNMYNVMFMAVLVVFLVIVLVASLVILRALRTIVRLTMPEVEAAEREAKLAAKAKRAGRQGAWTRGWNKLMGLRPISEEKDIVIDHEYDGIRELDNPVPIWFNGLFYATVVFGVVYLAIYHVFGWGLTQEQEYDREMARAEAARVEYLSQVANLIDENTVEVDLSPNTVSAGQAIYLANCAVCHGQSGEGGIGPNMTDNYWIHGGEINDIFRIVKYGVLDKGMIPWEQMLTPAQIAEVSNYLISLRGTNPPNPKDPEGNPVEYKEAGAEEPADEQVEQAQQADLESV